jgi:hypothetical protein
MLQHRLSRMPDSQKLVLVSASYVTLKIHSLPTPVFRLIWQVRISAGRSAACIPVSRSGAHHPR